MNVLGISGRDRDAAAALSVDGRVVAAASEESFVRVPRIGYAQTGGFPHAAVNACLDAAGVSLAEIDEVVEVMDGPERRARPDFSLRRSTISTADADALHAVMAAPEAGAVLVCSTEPPVMAVFPRDERGFGQLAEIAGAADLVSGARTLAETLGLRETDAVAALDRLSVGADPAFQQDLADVITWNRDEGVRLDQPALVTLLSRVSGPHAAHLSDAGSLNARVHDLRRQLAASFTCQLAQVVSRVAESIHVNGGVLAAGGGFFANPRFNTELAPGLRQGLAVAAVPETPGRAIGAAHRSTGATGEGLALGPAFSEESIKKTLDNCRLDYVYEPDWPRLLGRVSRMLAQGKVVAWFQGAMAFGPRALGTRSILCDPSSRYARQNMNEYLRQVPIDEPLPVVFPARMVDACVVRDTGRSFGVIDAEVRPEWRAALSGAVDWRHRVRVHDISPMHSRLGELLELHHASTGTPALIEANLAGPGEPIACTPRDAVRTVYSSSIDALVIGRFMLMKDYWLLRAHEG